MSDGTNNQNPTGTGADGSNNPGNGQAPTGGGSSSVAGNPGSGEWFSGFNDDLKGYVQTKGFKGPDAVVDAYRNLEKLHGVPQERLLKLPEKLDDASLAPIFQRLGKPEKPEGYNIAPEKGADENFVKFAQGLFHELGLTKSQGEKLAAKWNEHLGNANKAVIEQHNAKVTQENENLKKEWGLAYDKNVVIGKNAAQAFGIDGDTLDKLESVMGYAGVMKFVHRLGTKLGEDNFVGSDNRNNGFGEMTSVQAQHRIKQLGQDMEWTKRYINGGVAEREEMERLQKMAYPGQIS